MSDDFKVYCTENEEHFISRDAVRTYDFAASLLDFLYLDLSQPDALSHIFFSAFDIIQLSDTKKKRLITESTAQPVDEKELKRWHELLFSGMD